jgi:hypothetical protein
MAAPRSLCRSVSHAELQRLLGTDPIRLVRMVNEIQELARVKHRAPTPSGSPGLVKQFVPRLRSRSNLFHPRVNSRGSRNLHSSAC